MSKSDTVVWPVEELARLFPQDLPPRNASSLCATGWQGYAAGGEYCTFQLGLRTAAPLTEISVDATSLRNERGRDEIPAENVRIRWIGLVPVGLDQFDFDGAERPEMCPAWYPDPLLGIEQPPSTALRPRSSAGVHLSVAVPRGAAAGRYRGRVTVRCKGKAIGSVPLTLDVWPFRLPARPTFHITNWFQPDCLTKWHRCTPWSARHWRLLELYAQDMAQHRLNVIATPTLIGNFHNSDPMTLVDATRTRGGEYRFDFGRLGQWVKLFGRHGFELFEMWHLASQASGQFAPRFSVYDEGSRQQVWHDKMPTASREYRKLVAAFLEDLSRWLERRGLTERFMIHVFDEPKRDHWPRYAELAAFFRRHAPGIRHVDAISDSELITKFGADIDVPVPLTKHLDDADGYYQRRARDGGVVWWYTCCGPQGRFANRFVCHPVLDTRMLSWQAFARDISGYLHWGYNFWHRIGQQASGWPGINNYADQSLVNPYREHPTRWPVGDACIVYPHPRWWEDHGPVGSLRYEALRAGLQDYELLRMLERLVARPHAGKVAGAAAGRARRLLACVRGPLAGDLREYCRDPRRLLAARREVGACVAALA